MQPLPHRYTVSAESTPGDDLVLQSPGAPPLESTTPIEFGGPGDRWSPEALLVAAVASCFVVTFRGMARSARLPWRLLSCEVEGTLDRTQGHLAFTEMRVRARVDVSEEPAQALARDLLARADERCLVANSLKAARRLEMDVRTSREPARRAS